MSEEKITGITKITRCTIGTLNICLHICVCMWWLPPISLLLLLPPHPTLFLFFFLFSPSLSRLPLSPPSLVCMCVCCFFPSLFPPALKAALHHPPPLHFPFCFDLCNQGISCVRLMCFFSGYSGFPIHRLDMFGTGFLLFFFQGRTLPRAYCLFFLHHL